MMKTKIITMPAVAILLCASSLVSADIVELDLFDLGCQTIYDFNSPSWTTDFDLGVTFTEISNVYIDWAGEITAGLAIRYINPEDPFPMEVGIDAYLGEPRNWRHVDFWAGEETYPDPELFDYQAEFELGSSTWSDLLDGQGRIIINYTEVIMTSGRYVEHGFIDLSSASLIVDGVAVPEPATFLLLGMGALLIRRCQRDLKISKV